MNNHICDLCEHREICKLIDDVKEIPQEISIEDIPGVEYHLYCSHFYQNPFRSLIYAPKEEPKRKSILNKIKDKLGIQSPSHPIKS